MKSARAPLVMKVLEPLITYSSPSRTARVRMPGDVGAGARLGDAERRDLLALDRRHEVALLQLLGAELEDRRRRHVGVDGDAHRSPPLLRVRHRLAAHDRHQVVAALAAVLLREVDAEEAELAHALEDPVREAVSSHSSEWGASSFVAKLSIDSRSASCSSVKQKWRFGARSRA